MVSGSDDGVVLEEGPGWDGVEGPGWGGVVVPGSGEQRFRQAQ